MKMKNVILSLSLAAAVATASTVVPTEQYLIENDISVSGVFFSHDFNGDGKIAYNDYIYMPVGSTERYRLLGNEPSENDTFGWQLVTEEVPMPKKYVWSFAQIGDTDGDGTVKFDWVVIHNDTGKIYKLEGAKENGTFKYSEPLNVKAPTIELTSDDVENDVTVNISVDADGSGNVEKVPVEEAVEVKEVVYSEPEPEPVKEVVNPDSGVKSEPEVTEIVANDSAVKDVVLDSTCRKTIEKGGEVFYMPDTCNVYWTNGEDVFWTKTPISSQTEAVKATEAWKYIANLTLEHFANIKKYHYYTEATGDDGRDILDYTFQEIDKMNKSVQRYQSKATEAAKNEYYASLGDTSLSMEYSSSNMAPNGSITTTYNIVKYTTTDEGEMLQEVIDTVTLTVL